MKMKMVTFTVTVKVPEEMSSVGYLCMDAFGEFEGVRSPVNIYMETRYPAPEYSESFRGNKQKEVEMRNIAAASLHKAMFQTEFKMTEIPTCGDCAEFSRCKMDAEDQENCFK